VTSGPAESVSHEDAVRRLERLADRLRVVGPRLAARQDPAAKDLLASIRNGLQRLADLAADADGGPRRVVPELAAHALADQALVLGYDLLASALEPGGGSSEPFAPDGFKGSDGGVPDGAAAPNAPISPDGANEAKVLDEPSRLASLSSTGWPGARSDQDRMNAVRIIAEIRDLI
jgi:hypothetical protein